MRHFGLTLAILLGTTCVAQANVKVIATIKPIHALVASVMEGVGQPALLLDGNISPHAYTLKPADAEALERAQIIFWVGHELEAFLEKPLEVLGSKATIVGLLDVEGIKTLPVREDENFESDHDHRHAHDAADAHVWLDPENAKTILNIIAATLSKADKPNAKNYVENAARAVARLDMLTTELKSEITLAQGKGFIVFHDAYQYFERAFGLKAGGAISVNPENPPGAKQIAKLQKRIKDNNIACVFSEPQFDSKLVSVIIEGSNVKTATLDPLGASIPPGPAHYETLLHNITTTMTKCLTE